MGAALCSEVLLSNQETIDTAVAWIGEKRRRGLDLLRATGADVNGRNSGGFTPLFAACYAQWTHGVRELLKMGARPKALDPFGRVSTGFRVTQLGWLDLPNLADEGAQRLRSALECVEILNLLVQAGARLSEPRPQQVPMHVMLLMRAIAEQQGYEGVARELTFAIDND